VKCEINFGEFFNFIAQEKLVPPAVVVLTWRLPAGNFKLFEERWQL